MHENLLKRWQMLSLAGMVGQALNITQLSIIETRQQRACCLPIKWLQVKLLNICIVLGCNYVVEKTQINVAHFFLNFIHQRMEVNCISNVAFTEILLRTDNF